MTYDYQKLKYSEMAQYCVANEDKLMKNKKEEYMNTRNVKGELLNV